MSLGVRASKVCGGSASGFGDKRRGRPRILGLLLSCPVLALALLWPTAATADMVPPTTGWAAFGSGQIDAQGNVIVTTDGGGESGAAYDTQEITATHLTATFDQTFSSGQSNTADGMSFNLLDADHADAQAGFGGSLLGFAPLPGIGVTMTENAAPWGCYPSDHFLGVVDGAGTPTCQLDYLATASPIPTLRNTTNHVVVDIDWPSDTITVSLNGTQYLTYTGAHLPTRAFVGFSGGTGIGTEMQEASNVSITYTPSGGGGPCTANGAIPTICSVTPDHGPWWSGTPVTVTGANLAPGDRLCLYVGTTNLVFPDACASATTVISPTTLTATVPATNLVDQGARYLAIQRCCSQTDVSAVTYTYTPSSVAPVGALEGFLGAGGAYCSGAVAASNSGDVVLTAGHCVWNGKRILGAFFFTPGGRGIGPSDCSVSPQCPFGTWIASRADVAIDPSYLFTGNPSYDYAYIVFPPNHAGKLESVVGGFPITFNPGRGQGWIATGYPSGVFSQCTNSASQDNLSLNGPSQMVMSCPNLGEGASGGPWINSQNGSHLGIGAVDDQQSGCAVIPVGCHPGLTGTYLGKDARTLFSASGSLASSSPSLTFRASVGARSFVFGQATNPPTLAIGGNLISGSLRVANVSAVRSKFLKRRASKRVLLGVVSVHVKRHKTVTVRVRLTKAGRAELRKHRRIVGTLALRVRRSDGQRFTLRERVTVLLR